MSASDHECEPQGYDASVDPNPVGDDPAGAVGEAWTILVCEECGPLGPDDSAHPRRMRDDDGLRWVEVVSADVLAAALELADAVSDLIVGGLPAPHDKWGRAEFVKHEPVVRAALARVRSLDKEGHGG